MEEKSESDQKICCLLAGTVMKLGPDAIVVSCV